MGKILKHSASNLLPIGSQGSLTLAGTAVSWDGSDDADADWEVIQYQIITAAEGAWISYDGTAAAANDFFVAVNFTASVSRGTFLAMSFLDHTTDGKVIYQGFRA